MYRFRTGAGAWATLAVVLALTISGLAWARSIYVNGVKIDGLTNQSFRDCEVQIDALGNVYITAPGYDIKRVEQKNATPQTVSGPATTQPVNASVLKRYWMVTQKQGDAQYEIDVYVNSTWIRKINSTDDQIVLELTKHLKWGRNVVHFAGKKNLVGGRKSFSEGHFLRVIIGEGNVGGDNVMIDNPVLDHRWTAAQTGPVNEDFELNAR